MNKVYIVVGEAGTLALQWPVRAFLDETRAEKFRSLCEQERDRICDAEARSYMTVTSWSNVRHAYDPDFCEFDCPTRYSIQPLDLEE